MTTPQLIACLCIIEQTGHVSEHGDHAVLLEVIAILQRLQGMSAERPEKRAGFKCAGTVHVYEGDPR